MRSHLRIAAATLCNLLLESADQGAKDIQTWGDLFQADFW